METNSILYIFFSLAIYTVIVIVFIWWENRRISKNLGKKEQEMKRRMYEVSVLNELGERIGYSLNVQKILDVIINSLRRLLPYSAVSYLLLGDEDKVIFHAVLEESVNHVFLEEVKKRMIASLEALIGKKISLKNMDESISGAITDESNKNAVKSFFNVPVVISERPVGLLNVASTLEGLYKEEEMTVLYAVMNQASTAVSKLESILNQEKGKLNSMVKSMADGVAMVDTHNRLLVINPAAQEMLGIARAQPTILEVLAAFASQTDLRTKIEQSINTDKLITEDQLKIGKKVLRVLISPVKDSDNKPLGAVVLFHDITKEKAIEQMREDFTSMMVHELRNPLTGIRSIANLLKQDSIKNEHKKYQEFVDLIVSNSASMLDLVNDLLDVAKLEAGKFQINRKETDLAGVIEAKIHSFEPLAAESKLTLKSKIESSLPQMEVDDVKIGQVVSNLLSNAVKFSEKGEIIVAAFTVAAKQDLAEKVSALGMSWPGMKSLKFDSDQLILAVIDSGVGIEEDQISKLFNKFSQLEQTSGLEKKGTGLGLVISKGIADAHGGGIGVFSEVRKGSAFFVNLPMAAEIEKNHA
ncbi:MAG TPA: ATP-binding protein [Patescibacteria group bacterium]|jgi:PAS domain S-box-containing protein|nr:ATP-binding protein [Patescibacteria group bacterium]